MQQHIAFGGLSEWLAASPFITTGSGTELTNPGNVKLLNRSDPFFVDHSNSQI